MYTAVQGLYALVVSWRVHKRKGLDTRLVQVKFVAAFTQYLSEMDKEKKKQKNKKKGIEASNVCDKGKKIRIKKGSLSLTRI